MDTDKPGFIFGVGGDPLAFVKSNGSADPEEGHGGPVRGADTQTD
jgi:hypothetical protein